MAELKYLAVALAAVLFWLFTFITNPPKPRYAVRDFLEQEKRTEKVDRIVRQSVIHQMMYPLYQLVQQIKPTPKSQYDDIQEQLIKAGEFNSRPEDIQIAQLTNAVLYPLFFMVIGLLLGGDKARYILLFGLLAGLYMYRVPLNNLKSKQKKHEELLLHEFTRFTTVYLMQVSGNLTPDQALKKAIEHTMKRSVALSYYLSKLSSDIETKGTSRALYEFAEALEKPYVDRFVNNVQLAIKHGGSDQTTLNLRLRETLNEMAEQLVDAKILSMKTQARIPVYVSAGVIAIYMAIILGSSFMMLL